MLSFETLYTDTQSTVKDTDTTSLALIKRWINIGAKRFSAVLNREWRNSQKTFSLVADQQYYQMPEDCIKVKNVLVTISSIDYPLIEIEDENEWNMINRYNATETSSVPTHFYIKGNDEFGIYPVPSASVSSGGLLSYERRMRDMSQDDYDAGTIAVTINSAAVVGSDTTFTALMVGRSLKIADASGDGMWYKIASFTDTTHITLENTYSGSTASGLSYAIGEIPDIPEEYHESLIDYACYRYYMRNKDKNLYSDFKSLYEGALKECKERYGSKSTSSYLPPKRFRQPSSGYIHKFPTQGVS